MAWTSPRTWVAGETVTAALLNTHVRDNLKAVGDAWTAYTPTLTGMTIGNGTVTARYLSAGKLTMVSIYLAAGGTTAYTGAVTISLPVTAVSGREQAGTIKLYTGSQDLAGIASLASGATTIIPRVPTSNTNVTLLQMSNTSVNPGTGGNLTISLTYEAA